MTTNKNILKSIILCLVSAVIMTSCLTTGTSSGGGRSASADAARRQNIYMEFLRQEGYQPTIDEDGDIAFRREGRTYYIIISKNDPTLIYFTLFGLRTVSSESDRVRFANAVGVANRRVKVAKMYLTSGNPQRVNLSIEAFIENPNDFGVLFNRYLGTMDLSEQRFREAL